MEVTRMTMYAHELKEVSKIEQTPTHMHYLGEPEVYLYINGSLAPDHVILSGGRYYLTSDPLGQTFYHIRMNNAIYAFDSLRSYHYWKVMQEASTLKTVEDCENFATTIGYTITQIDTDVYRYENDLYCGWSSLEKLPGNLLDVALAQLNHTEPLISASRVTKFKPVTVHITEQK
jgi:hypothetical protein